MKEDVDAGTAWEDLYGYGDGGSWRRLRGHPVDAGRFYAFRSDLQIGCVENAVGDATYSPQDKGVTPAAQKL